MELSIEDKLWMSTPVTQLVYNSVHELKDIARLLEAMTPQAIIFYDDQRFYPRISPPPWEHPATHTLSVNKNGLLHMEILGEEE